MPTFYNFTENGVVYNFDDVFVPSDLFREGNLFTWGNGTSGALGNAALTNRSTPVTTFTGASNWKQVSCGNGNNKHTAAIKTDGTLWLWGDAVNAKLGNAEGGTTAGIFLRSTPITTFAGGTNWKQVDCSNVNTVAIKTDGTLWVWGNNNGGQLGNTFLFQNISTPITTFAGGSNWKQASCDGGSLVAIKTDGTLWTWGSSFNGSLGNGITTGSISTPITTFAGGTNWKQVSTFGYRTLAIKTDGTLWTWGRGLEGQLGNATITNTSTPVTTFAGGTNWKQVSSGGGISAAIKTDGTLWTWGSTSNGALGNGATTGTISTPITTFAGGNNWKQVECGSSHITAIKTDGTLWTWGNGNSGALGNAVTTNTSTPVTTFAGGTNWKQVSCGYVNTAALTYQDPGI
jgi:alpha-tubulin suppressor-like RCC1 family protein